MASVGEKRRHGFDFDEIMNQFKGNQQGNERKKKKPKIEKEAPQEITQNFDDLLAEMPEIPQLDKGELEVLISKFHRCVLKNIQMRSLHPDDASKFMDSEVELNESVETLHRAATSPILYPILVQQGAVKDFKELLRHENTDVTISVIHLVRELTEPDAVEGPGSHENAFALFEELLQQDVLSLLLENLRRLDETKKEDFEAIYAILTIFENYSTVDEDYCNDIVKDSQLFKELFHRMRTQQALDENKLSCAEILSVYVQTGGDEVCKHWAEAHGIEKCLFLLKSFQHAERLNLEEEEYVGNLFNTIIAGLTSPTAKTKLAESKRAIPVLIEYVKDKKLYKQNALRCLATGLQGSPECCARFVEEKGLKTIFSAFMKGKVKKRYKQNQNEIEEHLISIICSLFMHSSDISYYRLLNKLQEKEFEKIDRLFELHVKYSNIMEEENKKEARIRDKNNLDEESDVEQYERLLERGLVILNLVDLVIGFVATAGETSMKERAQQVFNQQDMDFDEIKKTLREFEQNINDNENEYHLKLKPIICNIRKQL